MMNDIPKVVQMPTRQSDFERSISEFKKNMSLLIQHAQLNAQLQGAQLKAMMDNGFTREEAIRIIAEKK